ncbi:MepB family protein [Leucobacter chromiireducens]|uniref:Metallopeptidase n=1 Tax=Leucobacter chromiireducens subsp. chromiireducens TaxID=660067 RepID=A0ABS1SRW4_9MICO|nr:MepB family protein [Leucobacter chromiireducens]MBL3690899.1 metallopeptidase [Leucobacter chromiireducens subsp. chromiireducens]
MQFSAFAQYAALSRDLRFADAEPQAEEQGSDYEAGTVGYDAELWRIRTARVTPRKPGAFVAFWERDRVGATRPFSEDASMAGLLVFVRDESRFGVFRFPTAALRALGIVRTSTQTGKRGFRLYPAWCSDLNPQAARTQRAQAPYFTQLR